MTSTPLSTGDQALESLVRQARPRIAALAPQRIDRWLLVDVQGQRLALIQDRRIAAVWPVSTAAEGLNNREGSQGTPPGIHAIERKIGQGQPPGMVFESRRPTGEIWTPDRDGPSTGSDPDRDLILTRVLTLSGLENGINRGPGIDSLERFIYIHGTNQEGGLGTPCSHGCVRMANAQVSELFERIEEGDPVVIA